MPSCDPSHFRIINLMKNKQLPYALPVKHNVKLAIRYKYSFAISVLKGNKESASARATYVF